ncbi:histidinol-phosphatase [Desulfobacterales bacterium HSG17]|nr:histidinol-phosphatase [Desulfobacterales bacterium HSG17]
MIDYHTHTALCNHARGTPLDYIHAAMEKGLSQICFLDHLTFAEDFRNSMQPAEVPLYFHMIQELKHAFTGQIQVKVGMEVDYNPEQLDLCLSILEPFDWDVIAASVHYIGGLNFVSRRSRAELVGWGEDKILESYLDKVEALLEGDWFDFVCHLDVFKKFGAPFPHTLPPQINRILDLMAEKNIALELNTSGMRHAAGQYYPDSVILREAHRRGVKAVLGSDAHTSDEVGFQWKEALVKLKRAGFDHIQGYSKRVPEVIPIP